MCEPTTLLALGSLAAAGTGTALQYNASKQQKKALDVQRAQEQRRQGDVMRDQMRLQEQQRQDSLKARDKFQSGTLDAYTREGVEKDAAEAQAGLAAALQTAGERAIIPGASTADATQSTGTVSVSNEGTPRASSDNLALRSALRERMGTARAVNRQQSNAQGSLLALNRAQQRGGERLAAAANAIDLENQKLIALNRPRFALGSTADASRSVYAARAEEAANAGAGTALAGQGVNLLGNLGYSYASRGGWGTSATPAPATALPIR